MSKTSRTLAAVHLAFSLITGVIIIFWSVYWAFKQGFPFMALFIGPLVFAHAKARTGDFGHIGFQLVQGLLCLLHGTALSMLLYHQAPLLPGAALMDGIAQHGLNLNSLFWLGNDLTPLALLITPLIGLVPLFLPMHPKVRQRL